jgi:hypothetical protein
LKVVALPAEFDPNLREGIEAPKFVRDFRLWGED